MAGPPRLDNLLKLQDASRVYYETPWHTPVFVIDLIINMDKWKSLTKAEQQVIDGACRSSLYQSLSASDAADQEAMKAFLLKGIAVKPLPTSIIEALRRATQTVLAEQAAKSVEFKEALESYQRAR